MSNWLQRVGALFGGRTSAPPPVAPARPRATPAAVPVPAAPAVAEPLHGAATDLQSAFFAWLLDAGAALDTSLHDSERQLLAWLDTVLASDSSRTALLPRAPAVIPQLLNSLRDDGQSAEALAQRVMKDPHLVAEVIRMANSAQARAREPVTEIAEAIRRLGTEGLRRAIARVVLKPMFDGQAESLSAHCAARLWQHSEAKASACLQEATERGLDPFEGYLAGLMHNIGWTAALRAIDRSPGGAPTQFSRAFIKAFETRRETFFALLVMPWQLTDGLTELGVELLDGGLPAATSQLGEALRAADERASLEVLGAGCLLDSIEISVTH
jgi:HDOD domain